MAPTSPVVAGWDLGLRLRAKRELLGLRGKDVNAAIDLAPTYLSSVEKGKQQLSEDKLRSLAELLEFDENAITEMIRLRGEALSRSWWSKYTALFSEDLLRMFGFEYGAESIRTYCSGLVYGMLQTERYARAVIETGAHNIRLAEVDRRVQARMLRQQRLAGPDPVRLHCVLSEAALHQQIGGPEVLAEQLRHLSQLINEHSTTLDLRIVPFTASGNDAMGGSNFYLLAFPEGNLPTLAWQETVTSTQVIDDFQMVREYALTHASATNSALDQESSLAMIDRLVKELT
ncbi:helix-turn-helix domain-containing protein [Actinophytocola sediminis]